MINEKRGASRFLIATGTNDEAMSSCIIWEAKELVGVQTIDVEAERADDYVYPKAENPPLEPLATQRRCAVSVQRLPSMRLHRIRFQLTYA